VLDPHPGKQHRRYRPETVSRMRTLAEGTPEERLLQTLAHIEPASLASLMAGAGLETATARAAWESLLSEGQVQLLPGNQAMTAGTWKRLQSSVREILGSYHEQFPLKTGMAREALRSQLRVNSGIYNPLLADLRDRGTVVDTAGVVRLAGHQITLTSQQEAVTADLLARMVAAGMNSPSVKECKETLGEDLYFALLEMGKMVQLSEDVVYTTQTYAEIRGQMMDYLARAGKVNVAGVRDLFGTSRKYAIAWLEHFDEQRITRRVGDDRLPY
jgi:selenocysteine-specific elongation factor